MRVLALVLLLSAGLAAQTRKAAVGRVLDNVGQPVAKASVTLFWTAPGDTLGEHTDKIEVVTDEHGRFMAQLLPQRGYSAFAIGSDGKVSPPRDGLAAGADIELRLVKTAVDAGVELRGSDAWPPSMSLRLLAFPAAMNRLPVPLEIRDGRARLPPIDATTFAILDEQGRPVWTTHGADENGHRVVELPPPLELRFRVLDEKGAPVTGAQVTHALNPVGGWSQPTLVTGPRASVARLLGNTDAEGLLTARVPAVGDPWHVDPEGHAHIDPRLTFVASKPGHGTSVAGLRLNPYFCNGATTALPADRVLTFTLRPAMRLRLSPPIARVGATLATTLSIAIKGGTNGMQSVLRCDTDAEGWFDLPFPGQTEPGLLEVDEMNLPDGRGVQRAVMELSPGTAGQRCDLTQLRRLSVQVLGGDAGPARGVPVLLLSHSRSCPEASPAYTDQAGRVTFHVGPGGWLLFVCDDHRAVWRSLRENEGDQDWQLTMQTLPAMVCRIVDTDGKPVAGAFVLLPNGSQRHPFPPGAEDRRLYVLEQTFAARLSRRYLSDADGRLRIPMLGDCFAWNLLFKAGDRSSNEIAWQASEEPVTVQVK